MPQVNTTELLASLACPDLTSAEPEERQTMEFISLQQSRDATILKPAVKASQEDGALENTDKLCLFLFNLKDLQAQSHTSRHIETELMKCLMSHPAYTILECLLC